MTLIMTALLTLSGKVAPDHPGEHSYVTVASKTVSDVIHSHLGVLTRADKQLAESLLDNYPVSGLGSI
ncbi:RpiR family transcriptional regulator, partial [Rhizobium leguminosarum]